MARGVGLAAQQPTYRDQGPARVHLRSAHPQSFRHSTQYGRGLPDMILTLTVHGTAGSLDIAMLASLHPYERPIH
jgi:hypothetical protein